jgi:23S rRNA pseudouridine1911/1915/1917 synthase
MEKPAIQKQKQWIVNSGEIGLRLDRFLAEKLLHHSRSFIQKLIKEQVVIVNNKPVKPSYQIAENDVITLHIPEAEPSHLQPEAIPLDVLYEDAHLLVINKPAGLVVHPGAGVKSGTLVNALLHHCRDLSGIGGKLRPGIVHRLDKNTTGVMVVAKDDPTHLALQRQFAEKTAGREYLALVWGHLAEPKGKIETYLNRSKSDRKKFVAAKDGKIAITNYEVVETFEFLSLLKIRLQTGRTHQIRTHFNYLHHTVFGDPEYSGRTTQVKQLSTLKMRQKALYLLKMIDRQALHAAKLTFFHPRLQQEMTFESAPPEDFQMVLDYLRNREGE